MGSLKMKKFLLSLASLMICTCSFASGPDKVEEAVKEMVRQYENTEGVECLEIVKGEGLDLIKMMLRKEFGKQFMKGVTAIIIIEYGEASEEVCISIRKSIDAFSALLEEFKPEEDEDVFAECDYMRCFVRASDNGNMSDFLIAIEHEGDRTMMYMNGEIIIEE